MSPNAAGGDRREPTPADIQGEPGHRVAAVQRFELNDVGTLETFERELERNARHHKHQKGLEGQVTLRLLDRPGSYLYLSCWSSLGNLASAIHGSTSCAQFDRLGRLADITPGQAVGVGLMGAGVTLADAAHAVLVEALLDGQAAQFELDFGALAGQFMHDAGFGGGLLLRSTIDPRGYLGLIWWSSAQPCDDALRSSRFLDRRLRLESTTARLTVERAQVAGEDPRP
ncbi:hypothetical protein [Streptomyces capitiformicae]|uniref:ABM domain-containing protein n=1 Tax=Streptomyces capitiformicae TaxID=2014920 RepID=A0A918ZL15_9ACTN|nr:hypothetical protein [Streptomyces capitiformicae]GHE55497.1 hypothetical protein GCM10017771_78030 [Streptomyces capitiformicae]